MLQKHVHITVMHAPLHRSSKWGHDDRRRQHLGKVLGVVSQSNDELIVAHAGGLGGVLVVMLSTLRCLQLALQGPSAR